MPNFSTVHQKISTNKLLNIRASSRNHEVPWLWNHEPSQDRKKIRFTIKAAASDPAHTQPIHPIPANDKCPKNWEIDTSTTPPKKNDYTKVGILWHGSSVGPPYWFSDLKLGTKMELALSIDTISSYYFSPWFHENRGVHVGEGHFLIQFNCISAYERHSYHQSWKYLSLRLVMRFAAFRLLY